MKRYKVVSLFSGGMGLDLGLEKTGRFEIVACVEREPVFCETIRVNAARGLIHGNPIVIEADICHLTATEFIARTGVKPGEIDLLVGGPPCQTFSTAGRRQTVEDPRGTLLWQFLRFIEELRPKFFLMENVRGLLSAALKHRPIALRPEKGGSALAPEEMPGSVVRLFADDIQSVKGGPYHMDCFEVNAVNYGAPQLRERVLFIGNRFNSEVDFPAPTHGVMSADDPADLFGNSAQLKPWRTLGDVISDLPEPCGAVLDFSPRKKRFLSMIPSGSNWRSLPKEIQQESMGRAWLAKGGRSGWWRRVSFDLPCPTLVTMPNHASTSLCHPTELRALSLREYARIQEFPDAWEFSGTVAQRYRQVGNAVPVRLGEVAGNVVAAALDQLSKRKWARSTRPIDSYRTIYVQSHVRTRQWFKSGKTFIWGDGKNDAHYSPPTTKRRTAKMGG